MAATLTHEHWVTYKDAEDVEFGDRIVFPDDVVRLVYSVKVAHRHDGTKRITILGRGGRHYQRGNIVVPSDALIPTLWIPLEMSTR